MRYVVIGTSGSGKSSFARHLAESTSSKYVELDDIHWEPNWTPRATKDFIETVSEQTTGESWVVDGNYTKAREVIWPRATHIIWLNYGRPTVFSRVLWRTLNRTLFGQELWAGNKESFRQSFLSKESILLWSVSTFSKNRHKYEELRASNQFPHVQWVEFKQPRDAQDYLRESSAVAV